MGTKSRFPDGTTEKLKAAMKKAKTKDEFRRVLCVWLRHSLGMKSPQVAKAVGWSVPFVRWVQARYLRFGEDVFRVPIRGGRRRGVLDVKEEFALLRRLREEAWPNSVIDFRTVKQAVERAAGHPVAPSVVNRMLARHGWGRHATVRICRQTAPASMAPALHVPSSGVSGVWYMPIDDSEEWKEIVQKMRADRRSSENQ
jgi:transposase